MTASITTAVDTFVTNEKVIGTLRKEGSNYYIYLCGQLSTNSKHLINILLMKKIFTLIAMALMAVGVNAKVQLDLPNAWGEGIKDGSTYTFNGTWQGSATWIGADWSAYDYVWVKYSGFTGSIKLAIEYDEWLRHQKWGDDFDQITTSFSDPSGIVGLAIEKNKVFVNGSAETDGEHKGETYDKHVRQVVIQDMGQASTITIEEIWVGTEQEYLEATGYNFNVNHALKAANGTAGSNNWDRQAVVTLNQSLEVGKSYALTFTVLCNGGHMQLCPIFSTSTNTNEWGSSNDVQYVDFDQDPVADKAMVLTAKFTAAFPHDKLQIFTGKIGGDIFFDNISCKEEGSDVELIRNGDFENPNIANWSGTSCAVSHEEKDLGEIYVPEKPKSVDLPLDNLSSGWNATYTAETKTIKVSDTENDGKSDGGKGWWYGNNGEWGTAKDFSDYDNLVIEFDPATTTGGTVVVEYVGVDQSAVEFYPGATCVVVPMNAEGKANIQQIYIKGPLSASFTLGAAYVAKTEVTPEAQLGTPDGISTVKAAEQDAVRYNVAGQKVDAGYKGLVIMNGRTVVVK